MNKVLIGARRILSEEAQSKLNQKFYEELPPEKQNRSAATSRPPLPGSSSAACVSPQNYAACAIFARMR